MIANPNFLSSVFVFFRQQREQANLRAEAGQPQVELDDALEQLIHPPQDIPPADHRNDATSPEDLADLAAQIRTDGVAGAEGQASNQRQARQGRDNDETEEEGLRRRTRADQDETN